MTWRPTTRCRLLLAIALAGTLASCAARPDAPGETPTDAPEPIETSVTVEYLAAGHAATWQVSILHPSPHPDPSCGEDEAVESSVISLDMPSSRVNYSLRAGATEEDARRVATCLAETLDAGSITVTPPTTG